MHTTARSAQVGGIYQVRQLEDLERMLINKMSRPLLVGDVIFCARQVAGAYEYHLVDVVDQNTIRLFPGEYFGADALGVALDWTPSNPETAQTKLLAYEEVEASVMSQAADFLSSLSLELHLERLRYAEPGTVVAGKRPDGQPLFQGDCAMLLKNSGGKAPKLTFAVKEAGKLVKRRLPLETLLGARIADDPGMEQFCPGLNQPFVLGYLSPGTILRLEPRFIPEDILGEVRQVRSSSHAMIKRVIRRASETVLMLSIRKRGGELCDVLLPTWGADGPIAVIN